LHIVITVLKLTCNYECFCLPVGHCLPLLLLAVCVLMCDVLIGVSSKLVTYKQLGNNVYRKYELVNAIRVC